MTPTKPTCPFWRAFAKNEGGSAIPLVALTIVVATAMAAFAVDLSYVYRTQSQLLTVAEAAALAAASKLPDETDALDLALEYAGLNLESARFTGAVEAADVRFGSWDQSTATFTEDSSGEAVEVTASLTGQKGNAIPSFLGVVLGRDQFDVSTTAIATTSPGSPACITALDPNGSKALWLDSNAEIQVNGCEIVVNSNHGRALYAESNSAILDAERVCVVGGTFTSENSTINPAPENGCPPVVDPFAHLTEPLYGGCDYNNLTFEEENTTLSPGVYCGGLRIRSNSNVTFNPGIYIIKNGKLVIEQNSTASGVGVGFFLTGGSGRLEFTSNAIVDFTAPSSGPLEGVVFFQDRNYGGTHKIESNNVSDLLGAIYLPEGNLELNSNGAISPMGGCTRIIAHRILFEQNSTLNLDADFSQCPGGGSSSSGGGSMVRLRR